MAMAARDARGPAEMVLTRMPYLRPASHASTCVCARSKSYERLYPPRAHSQVGVYTHVDTYVYLEVSESRDVAMWLWDLSYYIY